MTPHLSASTPPEMSAPTESPESPVAYTICIDARHDGTFTVEKETGPHEQMESPEMGGDMGGPPQAEPEILETFEDALKAAVRIHQANPVENSPQANFAAGFEGENMKGY